MHQFKLHNTYSYARECGYPYCVFYLVIWACKGIQLISNSNLAELSVGEAINGTSTCSWFTTKVRLPHCLPIHV